MLLSSSHAGRKELSRNKEYTAQMTRHEMISHIEDSRPKNIDAPEKLVMEDNGRIKPLEKPMGIKTQLLAWVVEHVALRNFAPRLSPEKRVEYYQKNPLDGYRFVEDLSGGAVISTHPIKCGKV